MTEPIGTIEDVLQDALTTEQYAAATDSAHAVLVIACAGSGKSRTLAFRIAWLIAQGAAPESIVAFTFTNNAADSIQQRVATALRAIGRPHTEIGKLRIGTIHSFCNELLGQMDARYRQFDVLDDNGLSLFLISRYPQLQIQSFTERESRYFRRIKGLADAWTTLNNEVLDLNQLSHTDPLLGATLLHLHDQLDASNYLDFSSMVRLIVDQLTTAAPGAIEVTSNIRHLLVDEYQDINPLRRALDTTSQASLRNFHSGRGR